MFWGDNIIVSLEEWFYMEKNGRITSNDDGTYGPV